MGCMGYIFKLLIQALMLSGHLDDLLSTGFGAQFSTELIGNDTNPSFSMCTKGNDKERGDWNYIGAFTFASTIISSIGTHC